MFTTTHIALFIAMIAAGIIAAAIALIAQNIHDNKRAIIAEAENILIARYNDHQMVVDMHTETLAEDPDNITMQNKVARAIEARNNVLA